ncbi:MAG: cysteine desulfurase-like protein [Pseudomonadota bacterium]|uniref:Cysteine desulfurase family protein (TIGR01976 family) n=1 Tax=Gallaecimonas pentaromativorans TaxID=584787 RepID=A0A3N1PC96_9GAMM|nr:cysteine desulfurase-like protein [Gallaecimonas pentaromativorans]MED5525768.1 cysteine desulfurase-like protein [Pseudomonadota bacterium]ROQ25001.1 cysteine desulfurase family protein (TIGR01976 family) [Gallaecimonas pentaromativorans]
MNIAALREKFPALNQQVDGLTPIFLDGPGGAQVPSSVLAAMTDYLGRFNANLGGAYFSSKKTTAVMSEARAAARDLLGAASSDEIIFGPNMTTLTFAMSRAISRGWQAGDEVIVTALDHYSNVSSWAQAAADKGATVHQVPLVEADCTLDYQALFAKLSPRTKLVALTHASNTTGSIVDVKKVVEAAHKVGALVWVDAVHFTPHELVDVQAIGCDFLACSSYKFFGPHLGMVFGRHQLLDAITPYKVEPATNLAPNKFETGTQSFEALAGFVATVEHLAELSGLSPDLPRRQRLAATYSASKQHEMQLSQYFLERAATVPGLRIFGITDPARLAERTPTFAFTLEGVANRAVSEAMAAAGICLGDGNFYALGLVRQLGLEESGIVRVGCMHYNTTEELARFFDVLQGLVQ